MKKYAFLALVALLFPILSPLGGSFSLAKKYSYGSEEQIQNLYFQEILEPTANTKNLKTASFWKQSTGTIDFSSAQNMFTLRIPKTFTIEAGENPIRIYLSANGEIFPLQIDLDGDEREDSYYYTKPIFLDTTDRISYTIETRSDIQIPAVSIVGLDTDAYGFRIAFGSSISEATAQNTYPNIMKRSDWGADESLRYLDSSAWQKILAKLEAEKDKPKSEATLAYEAKN